LHIGPRRIKQWGSGRRGTSDGTGKIAESSLRFETNNGNERERERDREGEKDTTVQTKVNNGIFCILFDPLFPVSLLSH